MINWYTKVTNDISSLPEAIDYYEQELEDAFQETQLKGSVSKASSRLPGHTAERFGQLQELEAILEFLNIKLTKERNIAFKKYLENYNRQLSSRDAEKYADADKSVMDIALLINQVALTRNKYLAIMKGFDVMNWQIGNLTRLKTAGFEDFEI